MKYLLLFALLFLFVQTAHSNQRYTVHCEASLLEASADSMIAQIGTTEATGRNDGAVEKYLRSVGLPKGLAYCAAGQYWCFRVAAEALGIMIKNIPMPRTGLANAIYNRAKKQGQRTKFKPQRHDLIVWRKGKTAFGHVERIIAVGKAGYVTTVGFNTSPGKGKSQRDGQGVWKRRRNIFHPLGRMRVRGLVGFITERRGVK